MRTALYVLLVLAAPALAGQTVYTWKDDKGVTHWSDQPVPGAKKVELSSSNRSANPAPAPTPPAPPPQQPTSKGPAYSRFVVESPQQDQAFINTAGVVRVQLAASPAIDAEHMVALFLDGAPVADFNSTSLSHELTNMTRGTHTVKATVSTSRGRVIQETPEVTFHVRQESAAKPPVGPAMRNNQPKRSAGNKLRTSQPSYSALNGSKAVIDPTTNRPVVTKPAAVGPKN
ncbi:DUF4124 domain-containing protein [Steroidobacter sp.]|uniref:DUF4124 domain-containing protein n=1 Tax=Steroidobacter sp. TaxID=1978227 RepID=UPI001A6316EB|nr:DUF4124 domain-containing protein [Steroidobacter sp.]MBL8265717.1 DUF4124 domain-containing protein [Steroidobacter sp.]